MFSPKITEGKAGQEIGFLIFRTVSVEEGERVSCLQGQPTAKQAVPSSAWAGIGSSKTFPATHPRKVRIPGLDTSGV